jgi:predicted metalloendopeptidase
MATFLGAQAPAGHGLHPSEMDTSVPACQDFFQYANGGWLKTNPIPGDHSAWGGFDEVQERNMAVLKGILEDAAQAQAPKGSLQQKVGDFYAAGMDTKAITRAGLAPLKFTLDRIAHLRNAHDLAVAVGRAHMEGGGAAFAFSVDPDDKESTAYIAQFAQGGLGLPDRDYYTGTDDKTREVRAKYLAHMTRMFTLMGLKPMLAKARAGIVLDFETRLARASMTRVEQRDPNAIYHKLSAAEFRAGAPGFDWPAYFQTTGLRTDTVLVRQPKFFKELGAMAQDTSLGQWQAYLTWQALRGMAPNLSPAFEEEHFAFYGKVLTGATEMRARWKRVQSATDNALGEALGRLYVDKAFSPAAKTRVLEMVANLRTELQGRILKLDWMSPATKEAAVKKLAAFTVKVGYPDVWRDYGSLEITRHAYAENLVRARVFEFKRTLGKLGKPIDRKEWDMTPPTVNAYYNPLMNEIVFPAGILQPPFFDPKADDAVNYGAIGMVIGHEMTHGFDDEGRQYDAVGNLKNWWTPEDVKAYEARTDLVVKQYDALEALPGLHLNGKLTLGENIADLGGLKIAFGAMKKAMEGRPRPANFDGFTPEQRFFLGYAQSWHFHARDEYARMLVVMDPHSPSNFRVNAPLANLPEFQEAFGCGAATPMNRPEATRPAIW